VELLGHGSPSGDGRLHAAKGSRRDAARHNGAVDGSGRVDLNADLGEEVTDDEGLLAVVTSANVACGFT
jgi:hypothetical protein